jgi:hypothetical protein
MFWKLDTRCSGRSDLTCAGVGVAWASVQELSQGVVVEHEGFICESVLTVRDTKEVTAGTS